MTINVEVSVSPVDFVDVWHRLYPEPNPNSSPTLQQVDRELHDERHAFLTVKFAGLTLTVAGPAPEIVAWVDRLAVYTHQAFDQPEAVPA